MEKLGQRSDYGVTCFDTYDGALIGGDSLSNNFAQLFSGFDDFDAASIENYWIGLLDKPRPRRPEEVEKSSTFRA